MTSNNSDGAIPGQPRAANAPTKSASSNKGPSSSRNLIARLPFGNARRATSAVCSGTSGHDIGRIDMTLAPTQPRPPQHQPTASRNATTRHKSS